MAKVELTDLARASAARRRADLAAHSKAEAEKSAVRAARDAGHSWAEIGGRIGASEGQVKWLAQGHLGSDSPEGDEPRPRPGRGPGVGVSEAARTLEVTRRTIYQWVADGRLLSTVNELGQTRVLLTQTPDNDVELREQKHG